MSELFGNEEAYQILFFINELVQNIKEKSKLS